MSSPSPLTAVKVLVVDDDEATRYAWTRVLAGAGATVKAAENAEGALQVLRTDAVDVLMSDLVLPGLSGLRLLERVRTLPRHVIAIAVTAFDEEGQRERAIRAGFDVYLVKPVDPLVLVQEIAQRMSPPAPRSGEARPPTGA